MQENFMSSLYSHDNEEAITPMDFYHWATNHTRLCQTYVNENDLKLHKELKDKIDESLLQGKNLLNSLHDQLRINKPLIPSSGINRFNQPKELLRSREIFSKNPHLPFKAELGTSCNLKSIPQPSRTYLKKKVPTQ